MLSKVKKESRFSAPRNFTNLLLTIVALILYQMPVSIHTLETDYPAGVGQEVGYFLFSQKLIQSFYDIFLAH